MATAACLSTTVKNISGVEQYFGYLGSHGVRLGIDEEVDLFGNLSDYLIGNRRKQAALQRGLTNGDIAVVSSPAVVLEEVDGSQGAQMLNLDGGTVGVQAPCWE